MISKNTAKGSRGFILWSPLNNRYFYRVYTDNRGNFIDYHIRCEELEVQIISDWVDLHTEEDNHYIDWNQKALGTSK